LQQCRLWLACGQDNVQVSHVQMILQNDQRGRAMDAGLSCHDLFGGYLDFWGLISWTSNPSC